MHCSNDRIQGVAFDSISKGYRKPAATILVSKLEHWLFCEESETSVQINISRAKLFLPQNCLLPPCPVFADVRTPSLCACALVSHSTCGERRRNS